MIIIKKYNNIIKISGHANYDKYGNDIVCASVSTAIYTVVNCIMNIDSSSIIYTDDNEVITIEKINDNSIIDNLLNTLMLILKDLEKQYNKNIKIESEE